MSGVKCYLSRASPPHLHPPTPPPTHQSRCLVPRGYSASHDVLKDEQGWINQYLFTIFSGHKHKHVHHTILPWWTNLFLLLCASLQFFRHLILFSDVCSEDSSSSSPVIIFIAIIFPMSVSYHHPLLFFRQTCLLHRIRRTSVPPPPPCPWLGGFKILDRLHPVSCSLM